MPDSTARTRDRTLGRQLTGLRPAGGFALSLAIAAPLASGVLLVFQAALLAHILGLTIQEGENLTSVLPLIAAAGALIVARAFIAIGGELAGQTGTEHIKLDLRRRLYAHINARRHALDLAPASGAVSAAIVDQVEALEPFFARYLPAMVSAAILPIAFAVILFPIDWIVALLFLFTAPLIPLFMALAGMGAQAATDRQAKALAHLSGHFADRLRGLITLKLFGRAEAATSEVFSASEDLRRRTNGVLRIAFLSSAILEFFAALGVAGVALYVGLTFLGLLPFHPELTLVSGLFALIMAPEVYQPLRLLAAHYHDRAAAKSALGEIERQIASVETLETVSLGTAARPKSGPAALTIKHLTVRTVTGTPVLDDLSLELRPGESLAIMGPSGIGKSTLGRAITRLIPFSGEIALDGQDLSSINDASLRARVSFITQKPRIFHGTLAGNIAFADPFATPQAVRAAADLALVTDFASALPAGLDTPVGEGGAGFSGGQIQRIGLARLFLTDPGLILLDEPTAHLDNDTATRLLDAIFAFSANRSLILFTHSMSVAARADRVMRMAGGKLFETPHRREPSSPQMETRA